MTSFIVATLMFMSGPIFTSTIFMYLGTTDHAIRKLVEFYLRALRALRALCALRGDLSWSWRTSTQQSRAAVLHSDMNDESPVTL